VTKGRRAERKKKTRKGEGPIKRRASLPRRPPSEKKNRSPLKRTLKEREGTFK